MSRFSYVHWIPKLLVSMFCAHAPLQVVDTAGVMRQPLELHGDKAAVLIFVGIDCPICNSYAPLINQMIAEDQGRGWIFTSFIQIRNYRVKVRRSMRRILGTLARG